MDLLDFKFIQGFTAPKGDTGRTQDVQYRKFQEGENVVGYQHPDVPGVAVIDDEWIVPVSVLEMIGETSGYSAPSNIESLPPEIQKELDRIKNIDPVGNVIEKSKTTVTWMVGGGLAGFFMALIFKKPPLLSTVIGGVVFGVIGYNVNSPSMNPQLLAEANPPKQP